ncbi:CvpA family protein [Hydrogenophaga sp.]|uniref:CvpA family protein n=1 Tax=Hydrogenophaga sp. TaxID=1904254 RepID=UPI00260F39C6|nr:CvpA family protein [Hydrogenophaga sp.]MCW5654387.1 CvpA family protein [Hydrogenophaga sp.]
MVTTDWVLLAVLLVSVLIGIWRGLVYEVLSLASWVVAFVAAQAFADDVAARLPMDGLSEPLRLAAAFLLVFIAAAFAGGLVAWLVKKLVTTVGLRPVDRVLGGAFGLARAVVMLLGVAVVVSVMQMQNAAWWKSSGTAGVLTATLQEIRPLLPEPVARHIH